VISQTSVMAIEVLRSTVCEDWAGAWDREYSGRQRFARRHRVGVTVQLIDALTDRHLWANRYDRTLADSLGLQGELAAEIAEALRVTLSPDEKARVETKPTENSELMFFICGRTKLRATPIPCWRI